MKVLFAATVMSHFKAFHEPYMEWFQQQGWEVHAAGNEDAELACCDKKHLLPIARSPWNPANIRAFWELRKLIQKEQYDIIHCHTPMGGILARLAAVPARRRGTKVIYTAHGFHFFKGAPLFNWIVYYPIERLLARVTDVLITINMEDYRRAKHFSAGKVRYVPGVGIDLERFQENDDGIDDSMEPGFVKKAESIAGRKQLRKEFGIGDTDIMLLSVGELIARKNHKAVLEALAELNAGKSKDSGKKYSKIKYIICGEGPLKRQLKQQAKELGIERQVIFAGYRTDIPEICHAADIFVFPSLQEGLPVALMEAMAAGLPIVASNIRGSSDLIGHKKNGYLVNPCRTESYVKAISLLIKSKERRKAFGDAARGTVQAYSLETVKKRMAGIYRGCMG